MSEEEFERPQLEPKGDAYRLAEDWTTDCKGCVRTPITVPAGFKTDGASIPRFLWRVCGTPMDVPRIYAAIVHDWLYSVGGTKADRKHADKLYRDYQIALGIKRLWANIEYRALRICGKSHWNGK